MASWISHSYYHWKRGEMMEREWVDDEYAAWKRDRKVVGHKRDVVIWWWMWRSWKVTNNETKVENLNIENLILLVIYLSMDS
jgi:hypothetical protein